MSRPVRYTFPRSMRLRGARAFRAVDDARVSRPAGPLVVYAIPNTLGHLRVGFAVSRRVGIAVARNRIKRRLRDALRHLRHDVAGGYDVVINVRPHEPLPAADYRRLLAGTLRALHATWSRTTDERGTRGDAGSA